ncbi:MAG TPA: hypothetical protein VK658_25965 [Chryseolinea sp.]|nr:hypothetical protein [Chryseolinea sp.]
MKQIIAVTWLGLLLVGIAAMFWYNEIIYSLPTPVPVDYVRVNPGDTIRLAKSTSMAPGKPMLLHFFNPGCPCSRFNIPHFKSLVAKYGDDVNFVIIPLTPTGQVYTIAEIQEKFDLNIPVWLDTTLAARCGVYSTPQAVIINSDNTLYYRGNYNRSRYCTDKKSYYAEIALNALLNRTANPVTNPLALEAYGCQIPICKTP